MPGLRPRRWARTRVGIGGTPRRGKEEKVEEVFGTSRNGSSPKRER